MVGRQCRLSRAFLNEKAPITARGDDHRRATAGRAVRVGLRDVGFTCPGADCSPLQNLSMTLVPGRTPVPVAGELVVGELATGCLGIGEQSRQQVEVANIRALVSELPKFGRQAEGIAVAYTESTVS